MPSEGGVLCNVENGIARVTLDRPNVLNVLSRGVLERLSGLFDELKSDSAVRGVILTGAGEKAFSAGADIEFLSTATPSEARQLAYLAVDVTRKIESLGKISVAAINGYALGGGAELAESCMLRVAASHARLGHPEVRLGAISGWGGTTRLPRLIGMGRAAELLLTGNTVGAEEARQIGLVTKVAAPEDLLVEAEKLLHEVLAHAPVAVQMSWEAMHRGLGLDIGQSCRLGADYFGLVAATDDFKEGTDAFLNKRQPQFRGR